MKSWSIKIVLHSSVKPVIFNSGLKFRKVSVFTRYNILKITSLFLNPVILFYLAVVLDIVGYQNLALPDDDFLMNQNMSSFVSLIYSLIPILRAKVRYLEEINKRITLAKFGVCFNQTYI